MFLIRTSAVPLNPHERVPGIGGADRYSEATQESTFEETFHPEKGWSVTLIYHQPNKRLTDIALYTAPHHHLKQTKYLW